MRRPTPITSDNGHYGAPGLALLNENANVVCKKGAVVYLHPRHLGTLGAEGAAYVHQAQQNTYDQFADTSAQSYAQPRPTGFHANLDLVIPRLVEVVGGVDGLTVLVRAVAKALCRARSWALRHA